MVIATGLPAQRSKCSATIQRGDLNSDLARFNQMVTCVTSRLRAAMAGCDWARRL